MKIPLASLKVPCVLVITVKPELRLRIALFGFGMVSGFCRLIAISKPFGSATIGVKGFVLMFFKPSQIAMARDFVVRVNPSPHAWIKLSHRCHFAFRVP